jgi:hypothetical protein
MKKLILAAGLFATVAALPAFAGTSCDDVKASIAKKLDGKGVKHYSLDAVAAADVKGQKVIGTCSGGTKKIVYARGMAKVEAPAAEAKGSVVPSAGDKVEMKKPVK